ncbi:MAG: PAS domain S-box protein [Verrucomicrobiota bacterium]
MNTFPASLGWDAGLAAAALVLPATTAVDLVLMLSLTALLVGITAWVLHLGMRRRIERSAEMRTRQMTELIEHAQCVLWEAEVLLKDDDWTWRMRLHPSAFCRQLFRGRTPEPGMNLWNDFQVDLREEMHRRAREAVTQGRSGYEQEFRAVRDGRTYWLHENVSITRLGADRFHLVGLVTDRTAQREAEAARRQSELTVERILAQAQCMLWRATVFDEGGVLKWPHFDMPQSRLSELLFGPHRGFSPARGFWDNLSMPEQAEMDARSAEAIRSGAPDYEQRFRAIARDGRTFWLNERVSITRAGEHLWSLVGVVTDITAQVEAEEARRRTETALARLLERADCLLWEASVELTPAEVLWDISCYKTGFTQRVFGETPPPTRVGLWYRFTVPERPEMDRRAREALEKGLPGYEQQFRLIREDGTIWIHERVTITPAGPNRFSLVGLATDITDQREAEENSRTNQERLSKLLDGAECMVWEAAVRKRPDDSLEWDQYIPSSALYRRIFGDPGTQRPRLRWSELEIPEYPEMAARTLGALKAKAGGYMQEFHIVKPEGNLWLRETVTIQALGDADFRMAGVITDITAQRKAEEARQTSELRLTALLEQADCMIWQGTCRRHGPDDFAWRIFTPRSRLFRRIFGRDPDGDCHFDWGGGAVPEFQEMRIRARQALTGGQPGYGQVFHYRHPDGDIWLNENVSIRPVGPDHWELIGIITDITAQRKSEAARQASEHRLQELLARADCLLWEATAELTPTDWQWQFNIQPSLLCRKLFGVSQPPPERGLWRSFDIPERPAMNARCRSAMTEGRTNYDQVFHIVQPDGAVIWISENVTIRPLGGSRYSLVGVAVDITAQRGAEEALAAEKERLAVTLRAMSETVITTDVAGCIRFMNPAAAALTEWDAAAGIGRPLHEICVLENARGGAVAVPVARVAQGDLVAELPAQTRLVSRHGKRRLVEGCCAPIHAADSKVTGAVLVLRDVTEQERLEQELVRATRLESVGVLAGGIAHDFNNILTAVMGNLALAQLDIPADSPAGASLRSAEKAALRARDLTQQLLTFAKGGEPVRAAIQLEAVVREMASFALHGSKVKAHFDMAPDLWPADADKGQIGRVVQNLVINAVQAMPQGGTLRISARNDPHAGLSQPGLAPGNYIQIAITDTGEGIKPEHLARIFDPYFTTKQTGSGLGLAAVYSIIRKHYGHIEVESQVGEGTTFRFWLPALSGQASSSESRTPWDVRQDGAIRGRVLFMDDEEIIRDMAEALLQRFGLTVDCAADGTEAVESYREALAAGRRYDLVIMDLTVPGGMGGLAALDKLRELDPQVKAVVSSGYSSDPVLARYREHGFAAVVAKPYEVGEIARVLRELLPNA